MAAIKQFDISSFNEILPVDKLASIAAECNSDYVNADPFPHIVLDDVFPEDFLRQVAAEFPDFNDPNWYKFDNNREKKLASQGDEQLGPYARAFISNLNSGTFINFLEKLTGIDGLIADPHLMGGGMHRIQPGGKLAVHVDFNKYQRLGLERRLNVLVYLNEDWEESFGGHFELWNKDMTESVVQVLPIFNRMAMFSTTEISWHGHPDPLTCPEDRSRRSIALYYYTMGRDDGFDVEEHTTIFTGRPEEDDLFDDYDKEKVTLKSVAKKILPKAVVDKLKK